MAKQQNNVLILTGFSGAGKDTIAAALLPYGYTSVIPHSTRPMREGESEGNPYYFVPHDRFSRMISANDFAEHNSYKTMFNGVAERQWYGTSYASLEAAEKPILTCGVQSSVRLKDSLHDAATLVFLNVPDKVREQRAMSRGSFDRAEWDNRLTQDRNFRINNRIDQLSDIIIENTDTVENVVQTILAALNKGQ